jgi:imidazolonepropionase-like amidohydrolase
LESVVRAIKGGTLIDGTGGKPLKDSVLVIEKSRISQIGKVGEVSIPTDAETIDANGRVVMPGLIDCHTHVYTSFSPNRSTGFGFLEWSNIDRAIRSTANAKAILESGVTTIRDCGSAAGISIALRDAIKDGVINGPRILACGTGLVCTGGHMDSDKYVRYLVFHRELPRYRTVDGTNEILKGVRQEIKMGADFIKFWATGGIVEARDRTQVQEFSDDEIRTLVQEARRGGVPVAVHALSAQVIKICIEAGVRSIEHGIFSDEECIRDMKENNVYLVPTLVAYELLATREGLSDIILRGAQKANTALENTLRMAKKEGVNIAMGTDSGSPFNTHGEGHARELELMVGKGLTEMESIIAATKTAAECCGISETTGTLEVGKLADLIILQGDPLKDIRVLQEKSRIKTVMKEGMVCVSRP